MATPRIPPMEPMMKKTTKKEINENNITIRSVADAV